MDAPHRHCRRCQSRQTHEVVAAGPDQAHLRCRQCGTFFAGDQRHAAAGDRTWCGLPLSGDVALAHQDRQVSCRACAAQRVYLPVVLPARRLACRGCRLNTDHQQFLYVGLGGVEQCVLRCACGRARRAAPVAHHAGADATACGLPLDPAVRATAADPLAVTCPACLAARGPVDLGLPVDAVQSWHCRRCAAPRDHAVRVVAQGRREELLGDCLACGSSSSLGPLHHLAGEPGRTRCGQSTSCRTTEAPRLLRCRACALAALAGQALPPDWRPDAPIAEDYAAL